MDEYRLHFEKDKALARRFQPVLVSEPSQVSTLILFYVTEESIKSSSGAFLLISGLNFTYTGGCSSDIVGFTRKV